MAAPARHGPGKGGKRSAQEYLPHRDALNNLTGGDPSMRRMGNYAKSTPLDASGASASSLPEITTAVSGRRT